MTRPRLAERYWASLTDSRPEALDHLIEHGRRRDLPLWRRYVASLLDIEPFVPDRGGVELVELVERGEEGQGEPTATVHHTLDTSIDLGDTAPARGSGRSVASWALAAVFVVAAVFGFSFHHGSQQQVITPIEIGGSSPRQSPPASAHRESGGFAWVTPERWRRDVQTGAEVHYTSPNGEQEISGKSALARGDLMKTWRTSEKNARQGEGYQKIRLEEALFQGRPAVLWEYTFTLKDVRWHAVLLGFKAEGKVYQINTWYRPKNETQALRTYEKVRDSFTVL